MEDYLVSKIRVVCFLKLLKEAHEKKTLFPNCEVFVEPQLIHLAERVETSMVEVEYDDNYHLKEFIRKANAGRVHLVDYANYMIALEKLNYEMKATMDKIAENAI